jgi:hypothetical protein
MWSRPLPDFFIRKPIALLGFLGLMVWSFLGVAQTQTITATGGGSFTPPHGITSLTIEVWGGGGAGGIQSGGGGGGGAYSSSIFSPVLGPYNYSIGLGGNSTSRNGVSTWFGSNVTLLAAGGSGGLDNNGNGGLGGQASAGFGSTRTNGATGANRSGSNGGNGGSSPNGGAGGAGGGNTLPGTIGSAPGGGGGGSGNGNNFVADGGNGQIRITWTCSNNLTSAPATSSQSPCINTAITPITYSIGGAYGANVTGLPTGVTANYMAGVLTISGTPTVAGTFNYNVTPTGSCTSTTRSGTITVLPAPAISSQSTAAQSICTTDTFSPISVTATGPGLTYQWYSNSAASNSGGTLIVGATNSNFTPPVTAPGVTTYYYVIVSGTCAPTATSAVSGAFLVIPNKTVSAASSTPTLCIGTPLSPTITHTTTNATGIGAATNLPAGITAAFNVSTQTITISGTPTASGPFNYSIPVLGCGPAISATGTITVTPNNTVGAASSSPTICINTPLSPTITHTTTGATGIGAATGLPTGVTASWAANTITISGTPSVSGVFNYTIPLAGGCGTVSASGTITVNALAAIITPNLAAQTRCLNAAFDPISVGTGQGFTYQWYSNAANNNSTGSAITGATSNTYTPPSSTVGTTYYYVVVTSATCVTTATSSVSGAFLVNPLPTVSFTAEPSGTHCVDTDLTYTTQSGQTNYVWTIPGTAGTDYTIVSGGNSTSNTVVIRWLSAGSKSITVNYTDPNGCGTTTAATSNTITVQKNTVTPPSNPNPSACSTGVFPTITHSTIGALGIGTPVGLPLGLTAVWSGTAANGTITISGTVDSSVTPGPKPYSIPLSGGCGTVSATGIIDVQPVYATTNISSVSPSNLGGAATITLTVSPAGLTNGSYVVNYQRGLANPLSATDVTVNFVNGVGTFSSPGINNADLTSLTVNSIRKSTDPGSCPIPLTSNNVTFFGIQPKIFDSNGTFFVPAGIFQITVKVYGGGGGGGGGSNPNSAGGGGGGYSEQTINVIPGEPLAIFVGGGGSGQISSTTPAGNGGASWVTRDSNLPNPQTSSIAYAFGGGGANGSTPGAAALTGLNGSINQPGNIGALPNTTAADTGGRGGKGGGPDGGNGGLGGAGTGNRPGNPGVPFGGGGGGAKGNSNGGNGASGFVIITFPLPPVGSCFRVIDDGSISGTTIIEFTCNTTWTAPEGLAEFSTFVGGGGGGGGRGSGAGGGGAGGLTSGNVPSNSTFGFPANTTFTINVGQGGAGATATNSQGADGGNSSIVLSGTTLFSAGGGGGGGASVTNINGRPGINGASGGGGGSNASTAGIGGNGNGNGGNGSVGANSAFAGGGGGGRGGIGQTGKAAGSGQGEGGNGGNGISISMGDSIRYFGGGGGGIGDFFNGTDKIGLGGLAPNGQKLGGDGNLLTTSAVGRPGVAKTGSGGGAGHGAGGPGGSGVVYIYYFNLRILSVEYQNFTASYDAQDRSGELNWTTSKEWENSHFEVERAVNDVRTWTKVGEVQGSGYSDAPVDYFFTDSNLPAAGGNIFYRLKQVNLSGTSEYSVTRSIQVNPIKGNTAWIGYPNPSELKAPVTVAMIDNTGYTDGTIQVRISDIRGIFSSYSVSSPDAVSNVVNSHLENARPGMYIVQLIWGSQSEQLKLIKK